MGIYTRGNKLWLRFQDATGRWRSASSGFSVGDEAKAAEVLSEVESRIAVERGAVDAKSIVARAGDLVLREWAHRWLSKRTTATVSDDRHRTELHIIPALGHIRLSELRPKHVRDFVTALGKARRRFRMPDGTLATLDETIAPRTVLHIYGTLRAMLNDAVAEEHIASSPCVLKRGELPKKRDKDPAWRRTAVFTRDEVETIISAPVESVPEDRHVFYGLLFLGAMRFGEAAALTWADYDAECSPLGKLAITKSYSAKTKVVKPTKTENPREMPVHPVLARILAEWKLGGFERFTGRKPRPDDLIVPSRQRRPRSVHNGRVRLHQDLRRAGLRPRRQHDARRTFITIALAAGALPHVLKRCTHGADKSNMMDLYSSPPWSALCEEVAKVKIAIREGKLIAMPIAAAATGSGDDASLQSPLQSRKVAAPKVEKTEAHGNRRRGEQALKVPDQGTGADIVSLFGGHEGPAEPADRDDPLHLDAMLAEVVSKVTESITVQAATAYWKARGVVVPGGFAEDAARNAAGALVEMLEAHKRRG